MNPSNLADTADAAAAAAGSEPEKYYMNFLDRIASDPDWTHESDESFTVLYRTVGKIVFESEDVGGFVFRILDQVKNHPNVGRFQQEHILHCIRCTLLYLQRRHRIDLAALIKFISIEYSTKQ